MYKFHCDYSNNKYDNKSKLLSTDTNSLMYEIRTEDVSEDFSSNKEIFDLVIIRPSQNTMMIQTISQWQNERWNRWCLDWRICQAEVYKMYS